MSWPALLKHYDLHLDANDFTFVGRWVTPPFSARRFDTWFFLVNCPPKQRAAMSSARRTRERRMDRGERSVCALATFGNPGGAAGSSCLENFGGGSHADLVERFLSVPNAHREPVRRIEFRPNYICFPVRTPTKPPATHTNCYLIYTSRGAAHHRSRLALRRRAAGAGAVCRRSGARRPNACAKLF